jgi:nucleoside-diphosphate-sugar epimerase
MRILITGHTGFIGRNLIKYLSKREKSVEIIGFSRSQGLDVLNYEQVLKWTRDVDVVYHLAAYAKPAESVLHPVEAVEVNVKGTLNVLEACRKNNFMLIYPSTCEIYGSRYAKIIR